VQLPADRCGAGGPDVGQTATVNPKVRAHKGQPPREWAPGPERYSSVHHLDTVEAAVRREQAPNVDGGERQAGNHGNWSGMGSRR
jgi:hypothetical protein